MKNAYWQTLLAGLSLVCSFLPTTASAEETGRFGNAADVRAKPLRTKSLPHYRRWPITVEMWVKLPEDKKSRYNLLAANLPGSQRGSWEIYTTPLNGLLTTSVRDELQGRHQSFVRITDGRWHFIAMTCDGERLSLSIDGKSTGSTQLEPNNVENAKPVEGELFVGTEFEVRPPTDRNGWIDELRISNTIRNHQTVPAQPLPVDKQTVALWRFDETEGTKRQDESANGNSLAYSPGIEAAWTPRSSTRPDAEDWEKETDADWTDDRFNKMDKGNFLGCSMTVPSGTKGVANAYAAKGLAIRVGEKGEATVLFDRSRLQMCAAWHGGFVNIPNRRFGLIRHPEPLGKVLFATPRQPGWDLPRGGRAASEKLRDWAPLPDGWGRYRGLHRKANRTVLEYVLDGAVRVRETPWVEQLLEQPAVTRSFWIDKSRTDLRLNVLRHPSLKIETLAGRQVAVIGEGEGTLAIALVGDAERASLELNGDQLSVVFAAREVPLSSKLIYWRGAKQQLTDFAEEVSSLEPHSGIHERPKRASGLPESKVAGPAMWTDEIVTELTREGRRGRSLLVVDTFELPHDNPYRSIFYVTGVGFLSDRSIAISTIYGDVWLVTRHPDDVNKLRWKRFAAGLYQPMGLVVRGGNLLVLERGQITQLWDYNRDGEADLYENFYNGWETPGSGHAYDAGLKMAPDGSFFLFKGQVSGGIDCRESGCLLRIRSDGTGHEIYATGFRHPIGLGVGPAGQVTGADQQGNWMPATRIDWYKKGGFYGDMRTHHRPKPPASYDPPICWIPSDVDNSAGGQVWVPEGRWGPLGSKPLHLSWGRGRPFQLLIDELDGHRQGGVVPLPVEPLRSGAITGDFNPHDGHLYVVGLHGWQTAGKEDGCLQRIRYTGQPIYLPVALTAHEDGIRLSFDRSLDEQTAEDLKNFVVERWNYKYSAAYGSDHWSVEDPSRMGHDRLTVQSVELDDEGKSLLLRIADMKPVMQMKVAFKLRFADGHVERNSVHFTVHRLRSQYATALE